MEIIIIDQSSLVGFVKACGKVFRSFEDTKKFRSYYYSAVMYPDSETLNFSTFLSSLKELTSSYCYILHDRDRYEEDSDDHVKGELKNPHYHIFWRFPNQRFYSHVVSCLNVPWYAIQPVACQPKAVTYLTHKDYPEKAQYDRDEIVTTFPIDRFFLSSEFPDKYDDFTKIRKAIAIGQVDDIDSLISFCIDNGCLDTLQKFQFLLASLFRH